MEVNRASGRSLTEQIRAGITHRIADGALPPGARLPSSRHLAGDLDVSRSVVVQAYEQLIAEGYLRATQGSGTRVAGHVAAVAGPRSPVRGSSARPWLDLRVDAAGTQLFPRREWLVAYQRVVREIDARGLGHSPPSGTGLLRTELSRYLGRARGVRAAPDEVLVTSGLATAFDLLFTALTRAGITEVAVEDPGEHRHFERLRRNGVRPVPVPVDERGIDVGALARSGVRAVLVTPAHQMPTGVLLAAERRAALGRWAAARDGLVIECDLGGDLWLGKGSGPLAVQRELPAHVVYAGSARGLVGPGLRVGWLAGAHPVLRAVPALAAGGGSVPDSLTQAAFAEFVGSGLIDQHLRQLRARYRARRATVTRASARYLPGARVLGAEAGAHVYLTLPPDVREDRLLAAAQARSVLLRGGGYYHRARAGEPALAIGYAGASQAVLTDALATLGAVSRDLPGRLSA
ncbi:GntR family transcriptional regulator [Amycolatopsis antarctica]|uniref:GntR family transcriptional regulator n=1 Tax=Amycolatopsis antarctica TaxID=1854586 RepID=A0A263D6H0_9PSEU|nr:GntR family transcriptional regulator [Amycolatopsis antarctica]